MNIPKIIHYCWFGKKTKNELITNCIESWKKYCPDYEIIEWNEENFDVDKFLYTRQAYDLNKYAFVSDVVRFEVLSIYGGIYLDTDVELKGSIDDFLSNEMFMGYDQRGLIASGLIFGATKGHYILNDILNYYKNNSFIMKNGRADTTTVVTIVSNILKKRGFSLDGRNFSNGGIALYSCDYFDPYDYENGEMHITKNTKAIHYYAASWKNTKDIQIYKIGLKIKKIIGPKLYAEIAKIKHKIIG